MSQLLKKYALLAACAVLALFFAMRPAHAQETDPSVDASGTGEHLFFGYWSTANYMNTQVNVHSPLGIRDSGETKNVVHIRVRNMDTSDNTVVSFNVCLTPGDSWTAALSMDGLMVMDPGECDDDVAQGTDTRTVTHIATPAMREMVSLGRGR